MRIRQRLPGRSRHARLLSGRRHAVEEGGRPRFQFKWRKATFTDAITQGILKRMTAIQWQAIAAVGTFIVAAATVVFAICQFFNARRIWREQTDPYVIAYFELDKASSRQIDFVIKNIGCRPAYEITLTIDPPMKRADEFDGHAFMETKAISKGIAMLAPSQEIRLFFESEAERDGQSLPTDFKVTTSFRSSDWRWLTGIFNLDVEWGRGRVYTKEAS